MTRTELRTHHHVAERGDPLRLHELLTPERVKIPLAGQGKAALVRELVGLIAATTDLGVEEGDLYRAVWDREQVLSTGIGQGIALPHAKHDSLDRMVLAAGVSSRPVDFDALDGRPVQLFFLMLGPESAAAEQVRVLSRISRTLREPALRRRLIGAGDARRFLQILQEAERGA